MKHLYILIAILSILNSKDIFGQCKSNWEGHMQFYGGESFAVDNEGNIFFVTDFSKGDSFASENSISLNAEGHRGFFILKTDSNLNTQWLIQNTASDFRFIYAKMDTDTLGNLYLAINGNGDLQFDTYSDQSNEDMISILKINPSGELLWGKTIRAKGSEANMQVKLQDLDVNAKGQIALLCRYNSRCNLDIEGHQISHIGIERNLYVHRLLVFDATSNQIFTDYSSGSYGQEIMGAFDDSDNYYLMDNGYFQTIFFGNAYYDFGITIAHTSYIVKYDKEFTPVLDKNLSTAHPLDAYQWNLFFRNGYLYMPTTYGIDNTEFMNQTFNKNEATLFKLNENLEFENSYSIFSNNDIANRSSLGASVDHLGNVYMSCDLHKEGNIFSGNGFSIEAENIIVKFHDNGEYLWTKTIGESSDVNTNLLKPNSNFHYSNEIINVTGFKITIPFIAYHWDSMAVFNWSNKDLLLNNTNTFKILQIDLDGNELEFGYNCDQIQVAANDIQNPLSVQVYPNPTEEKVSISGLTVGENFCLEICDSFGQILKKKQSLGRYEATFDMSGFNPGIYLIIIEGENNIQSVKILKK